ncbi:MAG TPA: GAF domain-containing protein [Streptosporangiaceae bacterium]|jgi:transcriptional regulator of acetoin/glycerol metabolism|nr:GAF domain-containing protein [Streptosporangiaceae bacterium]
MAHASSPPPKTSRDRLAEARVRFLTADAVDQNVVRRPILASWWRSRQWNVAADHIDLSYLHEPDLETRLVRAADPVLRRLHEQLSGQPISVILTDAEGVVLARLTADHDLERALDSVMLAPGFSYAEERVGTNGIGTALEAGGPAHVFGHEHYAEHLEQFGCAGVPIHDPVSGKTVGVIDLTCWRKDADPLMISLVKATADQITQALVTASSSRDIDLLQEYVRACRRTGGIVLALGNDVVMLNDHARRLLDPGDQAALIGHAIEALASRTNSPVTVDLPSGVLARMSCRRIGDGPFADGVVHVKLVTQALSVADVPAPRSAMYLPGLVGSGVLWLRACREAEALYDTNDWLTLEGESGVGKLALARAVHQRRNPAASFHVLDAESAGPGAPDWMTKARRELLEGKGMLLIRHVDALNAKQMHALASALQEARSAQRQNDLRVAVTLDRKQATVDLNPISRLLRFFQGTVELPPLRHHIEDLHELVPFFLARLSQQGRLTCSPEAMQLLLRHSWPGNTEQLWQVLKQVVQRRRAGAIMPKDLPPECWTVSRRLLSPLESIERDAIVKSLQDHDGNKVRAAEALGMSRATIYRKIHEYGIVAFGS